MKERRLRKIGWQGIVLCVLGLGSSLRGGGEQVPPSRPAPSWQWIWAADGPKSPETVWFRHRFKLPKAPSNARLLITADNLFTAYLNERKAPVAQGNDWNTVQEFDVTAALKAGENLLAVEVRNTGGPGGLLYKLLLTFPDGKTLRIPSNSAVRFNRRPPVVWTTFALDDTMWTPAHEVAPANGGRWGQLRGAPVPDTTRLIRLWDIHAGGRPNENPYQRKRNPGERMLLSASVGNLSDMQILAGAGFTLFQTDSDHLATEETAPNVWNWREAEGASKAVRGLGLDWCYFSHHAFPPKWYRDTIPFTRLQCLEHQQPIQAFSLWEPKWASFVDQGYEALKKAFGGDAKNPSSLTALYVGVHGDYGEAGTIIGARVAVPGQREDWERRFGDLHNHPGWWCHDPLARADFRETVLKKYGDLERLNAAWKRAFKTPDEITFPARPRGEARREWLDFVEWYQASVGRAVALNLEAARKHFPDTLRMLPAGFADEDLRGGNDNSLLPKIAAQYGADIRSTHGGFRPFAENAATMLGRLGSASRFYGTPFWTEPPGSVTADQTVGRIFEAVSQGAKGFFDWAGNAVANREVYYRYGKFLRVEKPIVDVAMFYPAEAQHLRPEQGFAPLFAQACTYLRDFANFDIVDDRMVRDGCLSRYRLLVLWEGALADASTLETIRAWVNEGGVLLAYDFGKIATFEGDLAWHNALFGYVQELPPARVTERYVGNLPPQYRVPIGQLDFADFLGGDWYEPETEGGLARRWTGANATIRLPVHPDKSYTLLIRAAIPPEVAPLARKVLVNGRQVGVLQTAGDITYRFLVPADALIARPLSVLTLQSETFQPSKVLPNSEDSRLLGARILDVQMIEQGVDESPIASSLSGVIRRELDLRRLETQWTRRFGKGLTLYFPARRDLLKGYMEVVRRAVYSLRSLDPTRINALPIDNAQDGVYATLFPDKVLYYNPKDTPVLKTVTIPAEAFADWKGIVAMPSQTTWQLTLEPHSITPLYFASPPAELLYECEKFTEMGALKPQVAADCSPGRGPSFVRLARGASLSTRIAIETPGRYALFTRCLRNQKAEPVDILLDGQLVTPLNARAGQTLLSATVNLERGTHTLTLRAKPNRDVRADFLLLTSDPTLAGYDFAIRTAPVE